MAESAYILTPSFNLAAQEQAREQKLLFHRENGLDARTRSEASMRARSIPFIALALDLVVASTPFS